MIKGLNKHLNKEEVKSDLRKLLEEGFKKYLVEIKVVRGKSSFNKSIIMDYADFN